MYDYNVEVTEPGGTLTTLDEANVQIIEIEIESISVAEVVVEGPQGPGLLQTVEEGTTGWEDQPDGTLWIEYTPA